LIAEGGDMMLKGKKQGVQVSVIKTRRPSGPKRSPETSSAHEADHVRALAREVLPKGEPSSNVRTN
jgi:hypothetical protein